MDEIALFLASITNKTKQDDSQKLLNLLTDVSGYKPNLQGKIIGFGQYHYQYESGLEGDSVVIGFSPRAQNIAIYIMPGFSNYQAQLIPIDFMNRSILNEDKFSVARRLIEQ